MQLFPAPAYAKNGADIRLAVETVEDMFRRPDITHVVIVAGDSDYDVVRRFRGDIIIPSTSKEQ